MAELDLERPDDDDPGDKERKPRGQSERSQRRHAANIRDRLGNIFDRLADSIDGRGDAELAAMIREDKAAMVNGLVSVTRRVPQLAGVIMAALAVLEPLIAFGRVFRLMARRAGERRAERAAEWDEQPPPEYEQQPPPPGPQPPAADEPAIAEPWKL